MRVVITTVGSTGDIQPFLALAGHLARAGHAVRVCSWRMHAARFAALPGVEFIPIGPDLQASDVVATAGQLARRGDVMSQVRGLYDLFLAGDVSREYADCREATRGFDLAICHSAYTLAEAAVMDNAVPWIAVRLEPTSIPTAYSPPMLLPNWGCLANRFFWGLSEAALARLDRKLHTALEAIGRAHSDLRMFRTVSPCLNLVACSRYIYPVPPDLPPRFHVTGPWWLEESSYTPPPELARFLAEEPRPVVVALGTMAPPNAASAMSRVLEAIDRGGWRVVVQHAGPSAAPAATIAAPAYRSSMPAPSTASIAPSAPIGPTVAASRVLFVDYVPHAYLFSRAACVIHHGGAGTTAAVCRAGVPSIVIPHLWDQFYWADRLHHLGVAPAPLRITKVTPADLGQRLHDVLTAPAYARQARALGERMQGEDGVAEAMRYIEEAL